MQPIPLDPSRRPSGSVPLPPFSSLAGHVGVVARATTDRDEALPIPAAVDGPRLFVRHAACRRAGYLQRLLRLDIWGDTLLGSKVRDELATGYLILGVVFLFEICAWSLLFNYVFHGAGFETDWRTAAAIGLGLLWGLGIFAIDKGLITADLVRPGAGKWWGFAARAVLILISAGFTAQPVEQLVFRSMIQERLKQETLREEAVAHIVRLEKLQDQIHQEDQKALDARVSPMALADLEKERGQRSTRREALAQVSADVTRIETTLEKARAERARRWKAFEHKRSTDGVDSAAATTTYRGWQIQSRRVTALEGELNDARAAQVVAAATAQTTQETFDEAEAAYQRELARSRALKKEREEKLAKDEQAYHQFFDEVRQAGYGDRITRPDGEPLRWKRVDFIESSLILSDLRAGRPPRWPAESAAQRAKAVALFGLPDGGTARDVRVDVPAIGAPAGVAPVAPRPEPTRSIFWPWLFVLLLAGAIPSLSLFFKFTMSDELKSYYSIDRQARAGNAEALLLLRARRRQPAAAAP